MLQHFVKFFMFIFRFFSLTILCLFSLFSFGIPNLVFFPPGVGAQELESIFFDRGEYKIACFERPVLVNTPNIVLYCVFRHSVLCRVVEYDDLQIIGVLNLESLRIIANVLRVEVDVDDRIDYRR